MKYCRTNVLAGISMAAVLAASAGAAGAQQARSSQIGSNIGIGNGLRGVPTTSGFGGYGGYGSFGGFGGYTGYGFGAPLYMMPYGGRYDYKDPTLTITPNGQVEALGQGYNGYTGVGANANGTEWQILRDAYARGYQDAMNGTDNGSAADQSVAPVEGMTATPPAARAATRVPHGSDTVRAWRVGHGSVALRWQGDPRTAASVTFALVDRNGRVIRRSTVDQLPAEIHFTPPANAYYYQVNVQYVDGATNTIMSRLPR